MATKLLGASRAGVAVPSTRSRGVFQRLKAALSRFEERSRIHSELSQMSTRELADLGLSPSEIPDVVRGTYRRP